MSRRRLPFGRNQRGATAVEFALAAPVLLMFIIGIAQLGILFFANAGLKSAVAHGARYATIYPRPSDAEIKSKALQQRFGMDPDYIVGPELAHGSSDGVSYVDISMSYTVPIDFLFFETPPVTLSVTRRAFVHPVA